MDATSNPQAFKCVENDRSRGIPDQPGTRRVTGFRCPVDTPASNAGDHRIPQSETVRDANSDWICGLLDYWIVGLSDCWEAAAYFTQSSINHRKPGIRAHGIVHLTAKMDAYPRSLCDYTLPLETSSGKHGLRGPSIGWELRYSWISGVAG